MFLVNFARYCKKNCVKPIFVNFRFKKKQANSKLILLKSVLLWIEISWYIYSYFISIITLHLFENYSSHKLFPSEFGSVFANFRVFQSFVLSSFKLFVCCRQIPSMDAFLLNIQFIKKTENQFRMNKT